MKYFLSKYGKLLIACFSVLAWVIWGIFWTYPRTYDRLLVYEQTQNYQKAVELLEELRRESGLSLKREKQLMQYYIKLKDQEMKKTTPKFKIGIKKKQFKELKEKVE